MQVESLFFLSPYKVKVLPGLGKRARSKLNNISLFPAFLHIVFSSFVTLYENPGKGAVLSHRGTLLVLLAHMGKGSFDHLA